MDESRDREEIGEGTVLSPEELDFTEEEEVEELDESRFVIGAEGRPAVENKDAFEAAQEDSPGSNADVVSSEGSRPAPPEEERQQADSSATDSGPDSSSTPDRSEEEVNAMELRGSDVKRWITANLERTDSQYAYRLAAKTGEDVSHQQLASDDIGMAFDGLLMWYAQQVGDGTAVEDTLGILLAESNIRVRFPVVGMISYLEKHDLSPDDSIGELLSVIREHDGLVFPRGRQR